MSKTRKSPHPRSSAPKFPGITEHADALGVSRTHLYLVLSGKRQSRRLKTAYDRLTRAVA